MLKAKKLKKGDTIAIISPSNTIYNKKRLANKAKKVLENELDIKIVFSPNCFAQHYYSAGNIQERISDFHWALKNKKIKGIFFSTGGSTASDLLPYLNYELIKNNPKIICGISDATTLLNAITAKTSLITFLGLEFFDFALYENMNYEVKMIKKAFFEGKLDKIEKNKNWRALDNSYTTYKGWLTIKPGIMEGRLIGGNFSSHYQLLNTEYKNKLKNNILIIETYYYSKKKIHRALRQLELQGVFDKISGLIIGYCIGSDNKKDKNDRNIKDLILEITKNYSFPIIQIGEIGHKVENIIVPIGAKAKINTKTKEFIITEKVCL